MKSQRLGSRPSSALPNLTVLLDRTSRLPLHTQLYTQLRDAILKGYLARGTRLPSTRDLAAHLGISRNTVINAFDQLYAESYVAGHIGNGTYVSNDLPDELVRAGDAIQTQASPTRRQLSNRGALIAESITGSSSGIASSARLDAFSDFRCCPAVTDCRSTPRPFRTSTPAVDAFPYQTWGRLLTRRWRDDAPNLLSYGDPAGYLPLRETIAQYLNGVRGMRCHPDQIVLTNGSQQGLDIVVRVLLGPGDAAWIEDPGFLGARAALACAGARLIPVPVDDQGMNIEAGIEQAPHACLAYVTPAHQYPLGMTLSLRRRIALLNWARQTSAWVIEDDYDSEFRYAGRPLPALQGIDADGRVIYIGTFSKVLFPAIQIGYIVAPPALVPAFLAGRCLNGHPSATLEQAVLRDFLAEGHFARHVRRMRVIYAERQRALVAAANRELAGILEVRANEGGTHLMGWLPPGIDDTAACNDAGRAGVEVTPLSSYCLNPPARTALRLGYAGYPRRQIWEGARRLAAALHHLRCPDSTNSSRSA